MRTKDVKHIFGDGTEREYIRLYADDGKVMTCDDESFWNCIDVLPGELSMWREVNDIGQTNIE